MTKTENKEKIVLPKEARYMMVSFLESENVMDASNLDDNTLLKTYNEYAIKASEKAKRLEVTHETKSLNMYMGMNPNIKITDKELISRLHRMNVPYFYLHLFRDEHKDLSDKELWSIVNKSGIQPINEFSKLTKMKRSPFKEKVMGL